MQYPEHPTPNRTEALLNMEKFQDVLSIFYYPYKYFHLTFSFLPTFYPFEEFQQFQLNEIQK